MSTHIHNYVTVYTSVTSVQSDARSAGNYLECDGQSQAKESHEASAGHWSSMRFQAPGPKNKAQDRPNKAGPAANSLSTQARPCFLGFRKWLSSDHTQVSYYSICPTLLSPGSINLFYLLRQPEDSIATGASLTHEESRAHANLSMRLLHKLSPTYPSVPPPTHTFSQAHCDELPPLDVPLLSMCRCVNIAQLTAELTRKQVCCPGGQKPSR